MLDTYVILISLWMPAILFVTAFNSLYLVRWSNLSISFVVVVLIAIFFSARGNYAGSDTEVYYNAYSYFKSIDFHGLYLGGFKFGTSINDYGFVILSFFLSKISNGFSVYLFLLSALSIFLFIRAYIKILGRDGWVAFFVFACSLTIFFSLGNVIRQALVLPLTVIAAHYYNVGSYRSKLLAVILFFFCMSFHFTAVIPFFSIIIVGLINRAKVISLPGVFACLSLVVFIVYFVIYIFISLGLGSEFYVVEKLNFYLEGSNDFVGLGAILYPLFFVLIFAFVVGLQRGPFRAWLLYYVVLYGIQLLFLFDATVFNRVGMYRFFLEPFFLVVFANAISQSDRRVKLLVVSLLMLVSLGYLVLYVSNNPAIIETLS